MKGIQMSKDSAFLLCCLFALFDLVQALTVVAFGYAQSIWSAKNMELSCSRAD
jgi:hypothetical protein